MATDASTTTPYSTVAPFFGATPAYVRTEDAERINSYLTFEQIYWNDPNAYKVVGRGDDFDSIYVPNGRTIVDTTNRYVASGFGYSVVAGTDPATGNPIGTPEQIALAQSIMANWFKRERFLSKFAMNKRYGMIRGDWLWHIIADPLKLEGTRISVDAVDPGSWFPVFDDNDPDKIIRMHLVDVFFNEAGDKRLKRLTYDKDPETGLITMSEAVYELDGWWKIDAEPELIVTPPTALPAEIMHFPIYHIPNTEEPANPYGSSELRGVERIIQAVSQAVTDEDLALALEGLGVYATDGGGPVDEEGDDAPWHIYPGAVLENAAGFKRVNGVSSLAPYDSHVTRLLNFLKQASSTPDVAVGNVDVQVAESGVALALQMGPMLAKAAEKDTVIVDVHTQMFYDLKTWFKIYEGWDILAVDIVPTLGDKLPVNVDKEIERAIKMIDAGLWSSLTAREELAKKGIVFAVDEDARVSTEKAATAAASQSEIDARMNAELNASG